MAGIGTDVALTHKFVSGKADGADGTLVQPSKWNQNQNFGAGTDGQLIVRDSVQADGASWVNYIRSHLAGLKMANNGTTSLDVAAGQATSDDQSMPIELAAITGSVSGTWVVGSGSNKLDAGSVAANTWYHVYVILRPDTGVTDILFSTSASSPTLPTNYTKKRRIGSFRTNGSSQITAFTQDGDYFRWSASVLDVSTTNPGTTAVTSTLTVPTGVNVQALLNATVNAGAASSIQVYLSDLAVTDEAPSASAAPLATFSAPGTQFVAQQVQIRTNTSAQIRYRVSFSDGSTVIKFATLGWTDSRGKNA